ncbi:hypothetical protein A2U01_0035394, partial [Trifolium medium]|nr:hypothetical protein [Trifolium medium]
RVCSNSRHYPSIFPTHQPSLPPLTLLCSRLLSQPVTPLSPKLLCRDVAWVGGGMIDFLRVAMPPLTPAVQLLFCRSTLSGSHTIYRRLFSDRDQKRIRSITSSGRSRKNETQQEEEKVSCAETMVSR